MAVSMHSDMNIGVRHLFPVYALLYVAIAGIAAILFARDRRFAYLLALLLLWQVVASARISPGIHGLWKRGLGRPG